MKHKALFLCDFRSSTGHVVGLCLWTWLSSFFYASNCVVLPIALRQLLGSRTFAGALGFLSIAQIMGPLLFWVLLKSLFKRFHFEGFAISIGVIHLVALYSSLRLCQAFDKDLDRNQPHSTVGPINGVPSREQNVMESLLASRRRVPSLQNGFFTPH